MIWLAALASPLLAAVALAFARTRELAMRALIPVSPLPALAIALLGAPDARTEVPWLLLGASFGFGEMGRIPLFLTAVLWLAAAVYARAYLAGDPRRGRFFLFFALSMSGNLGLVMAQDVATFYMGYAAMTFSAYGLVVHNADAAAYRAGRIYLLASIFGEVLLLAAIFLAAAEMDTLLLAEASAAVAASGQRNLIVFLAFWGFGVKAGAVLVHFWLPVAHPVAPVPGSAVLSGAMIKAGLLGWLHFLPFGHGSYPAWSAALLVAGYIGAFGAVAVGLAQRDPKTVLAYSSVSQMGVITAVLGIGLADAAVWPLVMPAVLVFALNHAFAKGALFLGVGIAPRVRGRAQRLLVAGALAVAALAIAGAPWTGGAIAKHAAKASLHVLPGDRYALLSALMSLASIATAMLLAKFIVLLDGTQTREPAHAGLVVPWALLTACAAIAVPWSVGYFALEVERSEMDRWSAAWPIAAGILLFAAGLRFAWPAPHIPAGDIIAPVEWIVRRVHAALAARHLPGPAAWQIDLVHYFEGLGAGEERRDLARRLELRLLRWENAAIAFTSIVLALAVLSLL